MNQRFIEESFPVKEVSIESAREKNIRHGHISTLHIWWARRPLASSRATSFAALIYDPGPENSAKREEIYELIKRITTWEAVKNGNSKAIRDVQEMIKEQYGDQPPKVLDPFAGGGAIPLEALRLGCETYASDYNPVATLILKCILEYPQKYGKPYKIEGNPKTLFPELETQKELDLDSGVIPNRLLYDVEKWGNWVLEKAKEEIGEFYLSEDDGSIPVGYIWARTIPCQNPACGAEIPLMRQFWLAKKKNKKVAIYPYIEEKEVKFKIVGDDYEKISFDFDPKNGTVSRAVATCPVCGSTVEAKTTRKLFKKGKSSQRMVAVVLHHPKKKGKNYRIATERDVEVFKEAEQYLRKKREQLMQEWGIDPVPDEPVPLMSGVFNVPIYGFNTWGSLFNSRQKLALITFVEKVRQAHEKMLEEGYEEEYAKAVVSYLAFVIDRQTDYNSTLCVWAVAGEFIAHTFGRQALPMVWDYFELCPWSEATGDWNSAMGWINRVIDHLSQTSTPTTVTQSSATSLSYPDNFFDAVFTDPPYYNSVPYADLSDFFYVWLKRTISNLYPELFSTPLTPKQKEITEMSGWDPDRYSYKNKSFFEENMKKSFQEIYRVLKPNGIAVIVYAHKSTEGWETLINSLLDSGIVVTAAWPIDTEMKARLRAKDSATLASSIYIVARKIEKKGTGFFNEVKRELKNHLNQKLEQLWEEGISGADFFIAGIGSAIEIFGKYEKVIDYEGNVIRADRLLAEVREIATDYAVHQILHDGFAGEISDLTRFYVLWRWEFGEAKAPFDMGRKLAQSCGIDLSKKWNRQGFIKKLKQYIRVLGPQERDLEEIKNSKELIDVLHAVLLLWEKGERKEMVSLLKRTGYGESEAFYRVAQATSETLPNKSKEKKLLDGFLTGKQGIRDKVKQEEERLF